MTIAQRFNAGSYDVQPGRSPVQGRKEQPTVFAKGVFTFVPGGTCFFVGLETQR